MHRQGESEHDSVPMKETMQYLSIHRGREKQEIGVHRGIRYTIETYYYIQLNACVVTLLLEMHADTSLNTWYHQDRLVSSVYIVIQV